jgi:hypothetical protein
MMQNNIALRKILHMNSAALAKGCQMVILKPTIPIWVNFGGPWNGKCWNISCPFGIFYSHLV